MSWQFQPYSIVLLLTTVVALEVAFIAWRQRSTPGALTFAILMLAMAEWSFTSGLEVAAVGLASKLFWARVEYLGAAFGPTLLLIFAFQYIRQDKWLTRRNVALLWAIPFASILLALTNERHHLMWSSFSPSPRGDNIIIYGHGTWFWIAVAYYYSCLFFTTLAPLDMGSIVAKACRRLSHLIEENQAELVLPAEWPKALGHAPWVEEVWVNYLSNATQYGGRPPRVELGAEVLPPTTSPPQAGGSLVRFWVRDNGDGIAPGDQSRLFTPFTRLDQVRARGHGLGLSIVQRIVEKLGGQVSVASDGLPGHGSAFSFTLPAAPSNSVPK